MPRFLFLFVALATGAVALVAQALSVREIQFTANPSGDSPYAGQQVSTGGIVTGIEFTGQPIRYFVADRAGGLWSGVLVNDNQLRQLTIGDSVSFTCEVQESSGQTRLRNIVAGSFVSIPAQGSVPFTSITCAEVAEAAEGVLIELANVRVVSVNGDSTFVVTDGTANVDVDRGWYNTYFPHVDDSLRFVRGIVSYAGGFSVNPRSDADLVFLGNRAPIITSVNNTPADPTELQSDTVSASISDDGSVVSARLLYRFGESGAYIEVQLRDDGTGGDRIAGDGRYAAVIPAGPARATCYYYLSATDNDGMTAYNPSAAPDVTYSYRIRGQSLTIYDLQYTGDPTGGVSPYDGQIVTVTGIVTGTGYGGSDFFMSDPVGSWPDSGRWSGVLVYGGSLTPNLWDSVTVTGQIIDYSGTLTEFTSGGQVTVLGTGREIPPLRVRPAQLSPPNSSSPDSGEAYEGVLVEIGTCVVTSTEDYVEFQQFDVSGPEGSCTVINDYGFDYTPVVGDSFRFIRGNCTFIPPASFLGHIIAPRFDADLGYIDRRAPELVSAAAVSDYGVNVEFNERIAATGVSDPANYLIVDQTDPDHDVVQVSGAYVFSTGKTLHLDLHQPLVGDHGYRIEMNAISDTSGNVLNNAVAFFGGYVPTEFTPIKAIYDSFDYYQDSIGIVTLRGIVNFVQDVTTTSGSRRISAYMQDNSGYGFSLSQTGAASTFPGIQRGNLIEITGVVNQFGGTIQLGSFNGTSDVRVLAENVPLPAPISVRTGDYRGQARIVRTSHDGYYGAGTWVKVTGTIYRVDENVGGGTNMYVDDGSGNLIIRIWDSMALDSVLLADRWFKLRDLVGVTCAIAGPSSTYNGDFQMLAGYADDFTDEQPDILPSEQLKLEIVNGLSYRNRPFAPDIGQSIVIYFNAPADGSVRLRLFDLRGHLVVTLVDKPAGGPNTVVWDGRNDLNEIVPLGTYILHLESVRNGDSESEVKPIVVGTKL